MISPFLNLRKAQVSVQFPERLPHNMPHELPQAEMSNFQLQQAGTLSQDLLNTVDLLSDSFVFAFPKPKKSWKENELEELAVCKTAADIRDFAERFKTHTLNQCYKQHKSLVNSGFAIRADITVKWTQEDESVIADCSSKQELEEAAVKLGRTFIACRSKHAALCRRGLAERISKLPLWTEEEKSQIAACQSEDEVISLYSRINHSRKSCLRMYRKLQSKGVGSNSELTACPSTLEECHNISEITAYARQHNLSRGSVLKKHRLLESKGLADRVDLLQRWTKAEESELLSCTTEGQLDAFIENSRFSRDSVISKRNRLIKEVKVSEETERHKSLQEITAFLKGADADLEETTSETADLYYSIADSEACEAFDAIFLNSVVGIRGESGGLELPIEQTTNAAEVRNVVQRKRLTEWKEEDVHQLAKCKTSKEIQAFASDREKSYHAAISKHRRLVAAGEAQRTDLTERKAPLTFEQEEELLGCDSERSLRAFAKKHNKSISLVKTAVKRLQPRETKKVSDQKRMKAWTEEEVAQLSKMKPDKSLAEIAKTLNRSERSCRRKLERLLAKQESIDSGVVEKNAPWTKQEKDAVQACKTIKEVKAAAETINRSFDSCKNKYYHWVREGRASRLEPARPSPKWSAEELEKLLTCESIEEIRAVAGEWKGTRSLNACFLKFAQMKKGKIRNGYSSYNRKYS